MNNITSEILDYIDKIQSETISQLDVPKIYLDLLSSIKDKLDLSINPEIREHFDKSYSYWNRDIQKPEFVEDLRVDAWNLSNQLFPEDTLNSIEEISLRMIITTMYYSDDWSFVKESAEFIIFLSDRIDSLTSECSKS